MTNTATAPATAAALPPKRRAAAFVFTDPGCRSDVRLGGLLVLAALFLWLWLTPPKAILLYFAGAPLLLWGIPLQAWQARRDGRPGFPWKLGLALAIGGVVMWMDLRYQEAPGGPVRVQTVAPLLLAAGVWILAWWPVALTGRRGREPSEVRS